MKNKMETLWAPWRMAYITEDEESAAVRRSLAQVEVGPDADAECFLCQAVFDRERDRQRFVLGRTETALCVLNRFPYNNGHLLIAPLRHCATLDQLTAAEKWDLIGEIDHWVAILKKTMNPEGFNIGLNLGRVAGAGLPGHIHWHIVPRWNGDTNFMTALGSTKVIPQALEALWDILVAEK